jgi:hypothetical protein
VENRDPIDEALKTLYSEARRLEGLAAAFGRTGNGDARMELAQIARLVEESSAAIEMARREETSRRLRECNQASANVLNAALAGADVERRLKDGDERLRQ